ncbi:hypothetical protein ACFL7M_05945 [Thermodesulfobacteriota bacterium]
MYADFDSDEYVAMVWGLSERKGAHFHKAKFRIERLYDDYFESIKPFNEAFIVNLMDIKTHIDKMIDKLGG